MKVRTRFAPSPTGFMHIGGIRTALFEYLVAKKDNGTFILRIEDTDQERYVEGATDVIYSTLKDLGLNWDEGPDIGGNYGPYIQSERKDHYLKYAEKLVSDGKAYYCFCDEERLKTLKEESELRHTAYKYDGHCRSISLEEAKRRIANGEKYVIRFKAPNEGITTFTDEVYGNVSVNNDEIEDLIMIKSDLMPTYNFANIVDDHEMEITHVIRGNEYISSTPKYVLMYQALGWEPPKFIHLPVIKKNKDSDKK
jgi:glutamyl-tRNA synthetase